MLALDTQRVTLNTKIEFARKDSSCKNVFGATFTFAYRPSLVLTLRTLRWSQRHAKDHRRYIEEIEKDSCDFFLDFL